MPRLKTDFTRRDCPHTRARHQHGTANGYLQDRCRCRPCTTAHQDRVRERRHLIAYGKWDVWRPSVGTLRRLNALSAAGYSQTELGVHAGTSKAQINCVRRLATAHDRVHIETHTLIVGLYQRLAHATPTGSYTEYSRRHAERLGWPEPWRWDGLDMDDPDATPAPLTTDDAVDPVVVERLTLGVFVPSSKPEREAARVILEQRGMNAREIARCLRVPSRWVQRHRAAARGDVAA
jgi:hypothetical protein